MLCIQSLDNMVSVFMDMVLLVTIRCKNTKGVDTETNNIKFSRAPMFS